jgi:hypothetical protein
MLVRQAAMSEFFLFQKSVELAKAIVAGKNPRICVSLKTKTRVSVSIEGGMGSWQMNPYIDGFKLHKEESYSYFDGEKHAKHYFVLSKKQGYGRLLEYIRASAALLLQHVPVESITLEVEASRDLANICVQYNDNVHVPLLKAEADAI